MTTGERAKAAARWIAQRPPIAFLVAGWVVFTLGAYPGLMSSESTMQLFDVRNGVYTDAHAPVMTFVWSALEWVVSGPFPMLALQSGLFLFGLAAILRTFVSPRAAAVVASLVLIFPPVFAPMAVIWRDSLMAGALLGAVGALLQERRGYRILAAALGVLACSCRPEVVVILVPLVRYFVRGAWWKRVILTLAIVAGVSGVARVADWALTDTKTYTWQQSLELNDIAGTLRRAHVRSAAAATLVEGLREGPEAGAIDRLVAGKSSTSWSRLAHGTHRVFEPVSTDDESDALSRAWRRTLSTYPRGYLLHRLGLMRAQLGIFGKWRPVYDSFGNPALLEPLHHRASASDWQVGMHAIVRVTAKTPLFRPWLYLLAAIVLVVLARRRGVLLHLLVSALAYEVSLFVLAPMPDYRFSHWLVTVTCAVGATLVALRVTRKPSAA